MRVYRVATKGQEDGGSNWVTSYYLAFSSDGLSYSNYTQGQNRASVSVILNTNCDNGIMTYLFTVLKKKVMRYKENILLVLEFRLVNDNVN